MADFPLYMVGRIRPKPAPLLLEILTRMAQLADNEGVVRLPMNKILEPLKHKRPVLYRGITMLVKMKLISTIHRKQKAGEAAAYYQIIFKGTDVNASSTRKANTAARLGNTRDALTAILELSQEDPSSLDTVEKVTDFLTRLRTIAEHGIEKGSYNQEVIIEHTNTHPEVSKNGVEESWAVEGDHQRISWADSEGRNDGDAAPDAPGV